MPRAGSLPDLVEGFGTAVPQAAGTQTLSVAQDGRVGRILHAAGEAVQVGEPILEWEASATARQAWEQARTGLLLARQQQAHASLLLERHLGTRDQLEQANKSVADAQAILDGLRREGADQPTRSISAPFAGVLVTLPVAGGDRVAAGAPLATVARQDAMVVTVGVDPARQPALHPGMAAAVQSLDGGRVLKGAVQRVDAMIDARSRLVDVDLSVPAGTVLAGSAMRAEITAGTLAGWLLPHDAVLQDPTGWFLFQKRFGHAVRVPVTVLRTEGDTDLVAGAVVPSLPVVLDGAPQLADGTAVREATGRGPGKP